ERAIPGARRVARRRNALARHAKSADLWADGRHGRSAHDVAPGAARRRAELGLSLLLASGRDFHALCAAHLGLSGGGESVARMALEDRCWRAFDAADPLWSRGRAADP